MRNCASGNLIPGSLLRASPRNDVEASYLRRLPFLDRRGGLFSRCRRQRRRRAGFLRLRIRSCRLRRQFRRPRTSRPRLSGSRRFGLGAGRRLQRRSRLRHLRMLRLDLGNRKPGHRKPRHDHDGGQQKVLLQSAFPVVRSHLIHRRFPRERVHDTNGRCSTWFPRELRQTSAWCRRSQ